MESNQTFRSYRHVLANFTERVSSALYFVTYDLVSSSVDAALETVGVGASCGRKPLKECRINPDVIAHLLDRLVQHIKYCIVYDGKATIK
jgi:hypothetical protein